MTKTFTIDYLTDDPAPAYSKAIREANNKAELLSVVEYYGEAAEDAYKTVKHLTEEGVQDFLKKLASAHKKMPDIWVMEFIGKYGAIVMPAKMMFASLTADQFHAPWGTAFIRCKEEKWPMLKK